MNFVFSGSLSTNSLNTQELVLFNLLDVNITRQESINGFINYIQPCTFLFILRAFNVCLFQSCEKALKAALYSMDANVASDYQTSHDLSFLSSAHSSLSGTSLSALATRFSTEITGQHTAMRYPTGGRLPGDSFTREQAEKAVRIAQQVLDECENCVS